MDLQKCRKKAKEKDITLVTTALTGKKPDPIMSDFEFNEDGTEKKRCPKGYEPQECTYYESTGVVRTKFDKNHCQHCPFRDRCGVKFQMNAVVMVSKNMKARADYVKLLGTEEYKKLTRQRNTIE